MIDPKEDGISHINIYSQAKTQLGRFLTNFSDCNIQTEDGPFRTIEGYWYWLACQDDRLRTTDGWGSKKLGRELRAPDWPTVPDFEKKILKAISIKLQDPWCIEALIRSGTLPFFHYYVYGSKVQMPKDGLWMLAFITEFRDELVRSQSAIR